MKLILDEWIVREVIDTLYMARTTFLGITGLESPQEVAKKSANETAITRRISKAIDIIQQSEQPSKDLDVAAKEYAILPMDVGEGRFCYDNKKRNAFIAGAKWQKEQMLADAVDGYVNYYEDSGGILMAEAQVGCPYHLGDKVKIIIVKEDEK